MSCIMTLLHHSFYYIYVDADVVVVVVVLCTADLYDSLITQQYFMNQFDIFKLHACLI